ncbi:DNA (cytosine-5)-methyltransferase 1 [Ananas comosus]|uniref:DNA (cytosine-5-)-methyltransferase n=1 Tax=Ananas comosus TaxID=4615 RepID=A0A199UZD6_ANACO|nr:DNA (cytosine-5)-methyltransferase 1 [Ananas comosus]
MTTAAVEQRARRRRKREEPGAASAADPARAGAEEADPDAEEAGSDAGSKRRSGKRRRKAPAKKEAVGDDECAEELDEEEMEEEEEPREEERSEAPKKRVAQPRRHRSDDGDEDSEVCFVGDPIPDAEAKERWPERYKKKMGFVCYCRGDEDEDLKARCHYLKAKVDGIVYDLGDDVYVKAGDGEPDYIGRIVEFFEGRDHTLYFTAQWFFKAEDTVIKSHASIHDPKRVFLSEEKNDNILDCIVSKIRIVRVAPNIDLDAKKKAIPDCDLYYDMSYTLSYSMFTNLPPEKKRAGSETSSTISSEEAPNTSKAKSHSDSEEASSGEKNVISLLDLYSGCGAMSTGLCLGAALSGLNLQTRWAVDINSHACESLKLNHPRTEVRNEKAEDFLALLKEWEKLCKKYKVAASENGEHCCFDDDEADDSSEVPKGEFEVGKLVGICYGDPHNIGKVGLKFKVRWKGYGPSDDTWEPMEGLSKCQGKIESFVRNGYKKNILPLPGTVDVICGGPPCQGISGFNRFRKNTAPLEDEKNQQMVVFMDIVEYLKPRYVLMENVVDILKFAKGFLGRYALSRFVAMNYQARLGMMVAGCYGLPQFRMRVFLWGALPTEILPQFPLPTHDVVVRGGTPNEFEQNIVAYDETQDRDLKKALLLADAISDLPPVENDEEHDELPYAGPPRTEFQRFIRRSRADMLDFSFDDERTAAKGKLFDHRPLKLNDDDYGRVCQIPKRKGANFRDLPGVKVGPDNVVEWDPEVERVLLPSGKPLVPDYAMSFIKGKSPKPFGRLWWDETVPTVVTRAEPHNQIILHPEQDRVLTIRENARLQGFPDYYKLCGPIKQRYIQVGNAVAVPVARALGYALGLAFQGRVHDDKPLFTLPKSFTSFGQATSTSASTKAVGEIVE